MANCPDKYETAIETDKIKLSIAILALEKISSTIPDGVNPEEDPQYIAREALNKIRS